MSDKAENPKVVDKELDDLLASKWIIEETKQNVLIT